METNFTKFILSEKGKRLLVMGKFKFCKANTLASGEVRWRCVHKKAKCSAKIYTLSDQIMKEKSHFSHNHEEDDFIERQALSNRIKRKLMEDISEKPSKLIHKELRKNEFPAGITSHDIHRVRKNLYSARRSVLPTLPKNQEDVFDCLEKLNPTTNKGEHFLSICDRQSKIIVFGCTSNFKFLCSVDTVYMDGTFKYSTRFFTQFFTIHGYKNGHYVPLVFCLLPSKSQSMYSKLFQLIVDKCQTLSLQLKPSEVVIDFELSIHKAVVDVWENVKIRGCRFHLLQAWYRKIQSLGLSADYNTENQIGIYLKHFFGLPFLKPDEVGDCFAFDLFENNNVDSQKVTDFTDYLIDNYIGEDSKFPPYVWASASDSMARTTNACESFHSQFNSNFYSCHPNLYQFVDILLNFQAESYIKIISADKYIKKLRPCIKKRKLYLAEKLRQLNNEEITRSAFVKCIAFRYAPSGSS